MNQSLSSKIERSSRNAFDTSIVIRDKDLCDIVEAYGLTVAVKLTCWTKPTIIKALKTYRPDLLKNRGK